MAGDASKNPGLVKDGCGMCPKGCRNNQRAIQCDECNVWFHTKCSGISNGEYADLRANQNMNWYCFKCVFPFELDDVPNGEIPNSNVDVTRGTCSVQKDCKIAHLNINRLINKMDRVRELITKYKFDVLALNETFLTSEVDHCKLFIPGYKLAPKDSTASAKLFGG